MLRRLFSAILENENEDYDLKDRAAFYCNILKNNINDVQKLLESGQEPLENFIEEAALKDVRNSSRYLLIIGLIGAFKRKELLSSSIHCLSYIKNLQINS